MEPIKEALTFDDVLLIPKYSSVMPSQTNIKTILSKSLNLNLPFLSSAMDTVTESKMAIAMAKNGGVGVIHRNLEIKNQCKEIMKVKSVIDKSLTNTLHSFALKCVSYVSKLIITSSRSNNKR